MRIGGALRVTVVVSVVASVALGCTGDRPSNPTSAPTSPTSDPVPASTTSEPTSGSEGADPAVTTGAVTSSSTAPALTASSCPVAPSAGRATCWSFAVPERHGEPDAPTIRIAAAVVEPASPATSEVPVVILAGGPGLGSLGEIGGSFVSLFGARPVVLVDYRGVGDSAPSLQCPEVDELAVPSLAWEADDPTARAAHLDAARACRDRLVAGGVDLAAYNYTEIAADLADLRAALGYDAWDLYGISNGGRVALEVVRRHPEGIRSLVLDAALPPQGNLPGELWPHASRGFDVLFEGCQADPSCAAAFPDLRATFERLVNDLGRAPVDVTVPAPDGTTSLVRFTDTAVLNALRQALYETALIPLLPFYISELSAGRRLEEIAQLMLDRVRPQRFSQGMSWSVNCQEEVAFLADDHFERQAEQFPALSAAILADRTVDECAVWDVGRADPSIEHPVVSDIPALVLVGEYDPVHPLSSSEAIAGGLSRATLVELPGLGHGTLDARPCAANLVVGFLADPGAPVDTSCVTAMPPPAWVVP